MTVSRLPVTEIAIEHIARAIVVRPPSSSSPKPTSTTLPRNPVFRVLTNVLPLVFLSIAPVSLLRQPSTRIVCLPPTLSSPMNHAAAHRCQGHQIRHQLRVSSEWQTQLHSRTKTDHSVSRFPASPTTLRTTSIESVVPVVLVPRECRTRTSLLTTLSRPGTCSAFCVKPGPPCKLRDMNRDRARY